MSKAEYLLKDLSTIVRGEVSIDDKVLNAHSRDNSIFERKPLVVVFPKSAGDITNLIHYVNLATQNNQDLHLTARGRGTDMTGGPLSNSIVVNVDKFLNGVEVVDQGSLHAIVQSGVEFALFEKQALPKSLTMPAFTPLQEDAAFGGMIANDCAGEKSLRYGKMHNYVDWVEVALYDGSIARFESLSRREVLAKMAGDGAESAIYRQIIPLIEKHDVLIQAHHPPVSMNSCGYGLWRVWDRENDRFNLAQLILGSQGTLGIITRARVKLVTDTPARRLLVVFARDWPQLQQVIQMTLPHYPERLECYDNNTLRVAMKYRSELGRVSGVSAFKMWRFLGKERAYRRRHKSLPLATILIELAEDNTELLDEKIMALQSMFGSKKIPYHVVTNPYEYRKFWGIRRHSYQILKNHYSGLGAASLSQDICIRPSEVSAFFPKVELLLKTYNIQALISGRAGNGNFHIMPLINLADSDNQPKVVQLMRDMNDLVWDHGGSISGEHNDGILRTPFIEEQFGSDMYKLFREVKRIFDPNNIFNPGKKVGGTITDFEESMISKNSIPKSRKTYA